METTGMLQGIGGLVAPERSDSEPAELSRSGGATSPPAARLRSSSLPDPEVSAKATRRQFTARYKRGILAEADRCQPGEIAALLRREGLYSSHLTTWRKQRTAGEITGLQPRKRGRKAAPRNPLAEKVDLLEKENLRLRKRLARAETIIDVQKKLCEILGLPVATVDENGNVK